MMRKLFFVIALLLPVMAAAQVMGPPAPGQLPVSAPVMNDPDMFTAAYQALVPTWIAQISPYATEIFFALAGLEVALFAILLWFESKSVLDAAMFMALRKILAIALFLTLLQNAGNWMGLIINGFTDIGKAVTGLPGLSPTAIMARGNTISNTLMSTGAKMGTLTNPVAGFPLIGCGFIIMFGFLGIVIQVVILKIASFIILGAGFIVLAFGGMKSLTNYAERYFSLCITIGLRLLFLYLMVGGGYTLTNVWVAQAAQAPNFANSAQLAITTTCGCILYAILCWFVPSFCSSALNGTVSLGHGEVSGALAGGISAAVSGGMAMGAVAARSAAAASGGSGSASTAASAMSPTGKPAGSAAPQVSPSGSAATSSPGIGSRAASAAGNAAHTGAHIAQIAANAARSIPNGHNAPPPSMNGFNH